MNEAVIIDYNNNFITVKYKYDEKFLEIVKSLDSRRFDWDTKLWKIGLAEIDTLKQKLEEDDFLVEFSENYNNTFNHAVDFNDSKYLFKFQKTGVEFLLNKPQALLCDDMGTGKTVTTLTTIRKILKKNQEAKILIIAPLSLLDTWMKENEKFTNLKIQIVRGSKIKRLKQWQEKSNIFLTNYETIRNDDIPSNWDLIILDEASRIKNSFTKLRKKMSDLKSPRKICLTGTPIENSVNDIYSIVSWLSPGYFGSYNRFADKYIIRQLRSAYGRTFWETTGYKNLEHLKNTIQPIFLRREKREVLEQLPALSKQTIWCDMTVDEKRINNNFEDEIKELGTEGISYLGVIVKMRVFCSQMEKKISEAHEIIKGTTGQTVVFCEFHVGIDRLCEKLIAGKISYATLTGKSSQESRKTIIEKFQNNEFKVLICQTKVGGYGLNLQNASTAIFLNRPYTIAAEEQAIGRIEREGQKNKMMVYYILMHGTFEHRVNQILEEKKDITNAVIVSSMKNIPL